MATATKVQMTRLCGPNPLGLKEPVGPHYVRGLRADSLLRWSLLLVSHGKRLGVWGQPEGGDSGAGVVVVVVVGGGLGSGLGFVPGRWCLPY